jgi:hypothetical protein
MMSTARTLTRRAARHQAQRQLREQREQARAVQERARRLPVPVRDDGPPPRID